MRRPSSPYRTSAHESHRLPRLLLEEVRRGSGALSAVAASGLAGALALGSVELSALAVAGSAAALAHWARGRRARRHNASIERFLGGPAALLTDVGGCSSEAEHRVRAAGTDLFFEVVEPSGVTGRSFRVRGVSTPAWGERRREVRWSVVFYGRALRPCCFAGRPAILGGSPRHTPAASARIWQSEEAHPDGVLVERIAADGRSAGNTVHPDLESARRQLEAEYGSHLGSFRAGDVLAPGASRQGCWEAESAVVRGI